MPSYFERIAGPFRGRFRRRVSSAPRLNPAAGLGGESRVVRVRYRGVAWEATFIWPPSHWETEVRRGAGDGFATTVMRAWLACRNPTDRDYIELYHPRGLVVRFTRARDARMQEGITAWEAEKFIS